MSIVAGESKCKTCVFDHLVFSGSGVHVCVYVGGVRERGEKCGGGEPRAGYGTSKGKWEPSEEGEGRRSCLETQSVCCDCTGGLNRVASLTHGYVSINIQLDSTNCGSKTVFPICGWSRRIRRADCTVCILHIRGLSILGGSVSAGGPGTNFPQTPRDDCS